MQSIEGQFDSSTRPQISTSSRFLTSVLLVTSHFSIRYSNGFCSSELTSIIPPLSKPARCTRGTSSSHPKAVVLHTSRAERYDRIFIPRTRGTSSSHPKAVVLRTSRTERYDRTFIPRVSRAWNGLPGDVLVEPTSVRLFKSHVNKLPLT
nr:unnamed protein product [Callosobruchus chinensis]